MLWLKETRAIRSPSNDRRKARRGACLMNTTLVVKARKFSAAVTNESAAAIFTRQVFRAELKTRLMMFTMQVEGINIILLPYLRADNKPTPH